MNFGNTVHACNGAGLPIIRDKIVRLSELEMSLQKTLVELESSRDKANLINGTLFTLRIVKASCDAFFGILGSVAPTALNKGASEAYSTATDLAGMGGKWMAGSDFRGDAAKFVADKAIGKGTALAGKGMPGVSGEVMNAFAKSQTATAVVVVDAFEQDEKSLLTDLGNYGFELTKLVNEAGKAGGAWKAVKFTPAIGVAHSTYKAGAELASAYSDFKKENVDQGFDATKRTITKQAQQLQSKIQSLRLILAACDDTFRTA